MIILALIWISSLIILIAALTDILPENPLKEYRLIVGVGFIAMTGFLGMAYRNIMKKNTNNR